MGIAYNHPQRVSRVIAGLRPRERSGREESPDSSRGELERVGRGKGNAPGNARGLRRGTRESALGDAATESATEN
jgi:hypothetical protein